MRLRVVSVALALVAGASAEEFRIRLTMMPIEVATREQVTGSGSGKATLEGRRLRIEGSFEGMQGAATEARLYAGPKMGVRGEAFAELRVQAGKFSGVVELSAERVEMLRAGRVYVQVHSESAPEGNLWGWLVR